MHNSSPARSLAPSTAPSPLAPPLTVAPDMLASWRVCEEDFEHAAEHVAAAHARDGRADDVPVLDLLDWCVAGHLGRFALSPIARSRAPLTLRANAFAALATKLGAPVEFVRDRMPAPLQLAALNYQLLQAPEPMPAMLRLRGSEIAAIVSPRYAPFDAAELLPCVREVLAKTDLLHNVRVRATATGLVDVVRLIIPSELRAVKVGDVSAVGLDISTSSFGRSALHVRGIVWRLKCTNGLRVPETHSTLSMRHIGDPSRLRNALVDAIPAALARARGLMDAWQRSVAFMVEDVERQITELRTLSRDEQDHVRQAIIVEAEVLELPAKTDLYTFTNGITAAARSMAPTRRLEVEALAAEHLTRVVGGGA